MQWKKGPPAQSVYAVFIIYIYIQKKKILSYHFYSMKRKKKNIFEIETSAKVKNLTFFFHRLHIF